MKSRASNAGTGEFGRLPNAYKGTTQSSLAGRVFASSSEIHVPKNLQKSNLDYGKSNGSANINQSNLNIGEPMTISREELDAKLGQNKAEVQAIASGMREEMAAWREAQNAKMDQISATLTTMSAKMDAKFETLDTKIDAVDKSLSGQIDGLKSSYSSVQWMLGIILALLAIIFAIPQVQSYLNLSEPAKQPQPTVIYVQQPPAQQSK